MNERYTEVVVGGVTYRIGVFSPMIGGLVALQARSVLSDENIYMSVMKNCLDVVSLIRERDGQKFPFKLYSKERDKWLEAEIVNPIHLNELMMQVTNFNLQPFIEPSQEQKESNPTLDTFPQSSPTA